MTDFADLDLAAQAVVDPTTAARDLAVIAHHHAGLRVQVAEHPNTYPGLLQWLESFGGDEAVKAVAARRERDKTPPDAAGPAEAVPSDEVSSAAAEPGCPAEPDGDTPGTSDDPAGDASVVEPGVETAAETTGEQPGQGPAPSVAPPVDQATPDVAAQGQPPVVLVAAQMLAGPPAPRWRWPLVAVATGLVVLLVVGGTLFALRLFGEEKNPAQPGLTVRGEQFAPSPTTPSFAEGFTEAWRYDDDAWVMGVSPSVVVARKSGAPDGGHIVGLDAQTGSVRWSTKGENGWVSGSQMWKDRMLYAIGHDSATGFILLDPETGKKEKWNRKTDAGWDIYSWFVSGDVLYLTECAEPESWQEDVMCKVSRWDDPDRPAWVTDPFPSDSYGPESAERGSGNAQVGSLVIVSGRIYDATDGTLVENDSSTALFGGNLVAGNYSRSHQFTLSNGESGRYVVVDGEPLQFVGDERPDRAFAMGEDSLFAVDPSGSVAWSVTLSTLPGTVAAWDGQDRILIASADPHGPEVSTAALVDTAGEVLWEVPIPTEGCAGAEPRPAFVDSATVTIDDGCEKSVWLDAATGSIVGDGDYMIMTSPSPSAVIVSGMHEGTSADEVDAFVGLPKFVHTAGSRWSNTVSINRDGSFTGQYLSWVYPNDKYPGGADYRCDFEGRFVDVKKVADREYSMRLERLQTTSDPGERVVDGMLTVQCEHGRPELQGFEDAEEFRLYLPGTSAASLPPDVNINWMISPDQSDRTTLQSHGLYNVNGKKGFHSEGGVAAAPGVPPAPQHYVALLRPHAGSGQQAAALPKGFPSCPSGMQVVAWTQYPDGLVLVCHSDKGFHVTVRHKGKDLTPHELTFTAAGWTVKCKGGTVLTVGLGGGFVTAGDGTWTGRGWSRSTGPVSFPQAAAQGCPPGTVALSLSTWNGGWLLVCGTDAKSPSSARWDDDLVGQGQSKDVTRHGAGFCVNGGAICAGPGEVVLSDDEGLKVRRPIGADWFTGSGPRAASDPQNPDDQTVVTIATDLLFAFGSAEVTSGSEQMVRRAVSTAPKAVTIQVTGHTDALGGDEVNLPLSKARAD
ncbi:MAG: OmpA family protein, partial [Micrococcales bacterium]|nr:OmpA family protein [Micrococcales bacterium]